MHLLPQCARWDCFSCFGHYGTTICTMYNIRGKETTKYKCEGQGIASPFSFTVGTSPHTPHYAHSENVLPASVILRTHIYLKRCECKNESLC